MNERPEPLPNMAVGAWVILRNGTVAGPLLPSDALGPQFPLLLVGISHYTPSGHVHPHYHATDVDAMAAFPTRAAALKAAILREPLSVHDASLYLIVSPTETGGLSYFDTLGRATDLEPVRVATKSVAQPAALFSADEIRDAMFKLEGVFGAGRDMFAIGGISRFDYERIQPDDPAVTGIVPR